MLVERELAKLMATLSAAAIAALVAMGQAKMIGTFMMTIAITGLLLALVGSLGVFSRHHAMTLNPDRRQKLQRRATTLLNRVRVTMIWTFVLIAYAATATMAKCDRSRALPWLVTETMCSQVAEVLRG
ncbi:MULTISPECIES: hypothetical protein [Achromobacter]|uniref:Uncharacterized protein n=1 Tax=Achromobacter spanius TaxID=217203 RepID=A0ABY8GUQ9_9BURK|nr:MULTISPECIES: hypothetical protein [Achromobacter]WAI82295.1 hypothetical protein N8Z00_22595 [Achromobacter spanius]WEX92382.1 hypothetical protein N3Z32_17200 [Achromobacter sp. SS2-2022]WFP08467.1 hypothetical protein P8T11_00930 [Achromobacter spanius]